MDKRGSIFSTNPKSGPVNLGMDSEVSDMQLLLQHFEHIGSVLSEIKKAQDKGIKRQTVTLTPGRDFGTDNFDVMSMYVDNSASGQAITIQPDGSRVTFQVAANARAWIHPLGARNFLVSGTGTAAQVILVDTFLPIN